MNLGPGNTLLLSSWGSASDGAWTHGGNIEILAYPVESAVDTAFWTEFWLGGASPPFPATLTQVNFMPHLIGR